MKRLTLLLLVIVGCSAPDDTTPTIDVAINSPDTGADTTTPLADRCVTGASWSVGLPAFANRTEETGLTALDARGVRISAVDYDSDGFADLFVRRVGATADDFAGTRASWLLRNRGDGTFEDTTQTSGISAARFSGDENLGRGVFFRRRP